MKGEFTVKVSEILIINSAVTSLFLLLVTIPTILIFVFNVLS